MAQDELDLRVCWYCGKQKQVDAPELGSHWLKCTNCGATYYPMRKSKKRSKKAVK